MFLFLSEQTLHNLPYVEYNNPDKNWDKIILLDFLLGKLYNKHEIW